ncbi:MAG: hypothetical protein QMB75_00255 [Thauera sp.]|uniref:Uncharacterized protein n=1 Tax=Thauera phenylacetica B4P TaxID=1234382 RepID=N6ZZJ5_9RHOO|nr:hypothetical protein [Thauera phenylacetica]ENO97564.1 hypothetical protein C667_08173 [Thauera phenylacetica B4P]
MSTTKTAVRIQTLEAQVNALAQAWLYLAATMEMQCGAELETMERSLCAKRWPGAPQIDAEARHTLEWLCKELSAARRFREQRAAQAWADWRRG